MKKKSIILILAGVFVGLIVLIISLLSEDGDGIANLFGGGGDGADGLAGGAEDVAEGIDDGITDDSSSAKLDAAIGVGEAFFFADMSTGASNYKDKKTSRFGRFTSIFKR